MLTITLSTALNNTLIDDEYKLPEDALMLTSKVWSNKAVGVELDSIVIVSFSMFKLE